ncbi:hypothetical protein SAMD00079811_09550 [Scytonema sp. HK-05]|nr:hypothetical protein NIES2130_12575 [Scytonema sp. HK-05]BAY43376.1 hypothetical protein SAMD00079811_09550 [Scytonema sp. HK-05]
MKKLCDSKSSLRLILRPNLVSLVSTVGTNQNKKYINLSPYCLFMEASHKPPRIAIGIRNNNDTYENIIENKDFVVNICDYSLKEAVSCAAEKVKKGVSEIDYVRSKVGISLTPFTFESIKSSVPGILEAPINIWCRIVENQFLTYDELCYDRKLIRTLFVADVLGIAATPDFVIPYQKGLDRFNPEKELLLAYGAGVFGKTMSVQNCETIIYANYLNRIANENKELEYKFPLIYSDIPIEQDFKIPIINNASLVENFQELTQ